MRLVDEALRECSFAGHSSPFETEAFHHPAVWRNLEMRFQLPATDELRNGAVEHERIEKIDVIGHEERGPAGVEPGRVADLHAGARKKHNAAAERTLQPIVLVGIQKNSEKDEQRRKNEKMQGAQDPENRAAQRQPALLHI